MNEKDIEAKQKKAEEYLVSKFGDLVNPELIREGFREFRTFFDTCLAELEYPIKEENQAYIIVLTFLAGYVQRKTNMIHASGSTEKKHRGKVDPDRYQTANWTQLESLAGKECPCCDKKFSRDNPPDLAGKCHQGPAFVSYWSDYIYLTCPKCNKPICKIPVSTKLI